MEELAPLVKANPDDNAVLLRLRRISTNAIGNVLDARTIFTQILTRQPENGEAYLGRAVRRWPRGYDARHADTSDLLAA